MTSVDYDLDSAGGLMPKIQALIAPPESDDTSKSKKKEGLDRHPYYKRPGKGHNHDCCDSCGEGGNLICCDKCPASFHLSCHDPPLEDNDIPSGLWLCHKCRMLAGLPTLKLVPGDNKSDKADNNSDSASITSKDGSTPSETPTRGRSRTSSTASVESNKSRGRGKSAPIAPIVPSGPVITVSTACGPDKQSAMEMLIAAASSMNPKQFELPREMVLPINFPGTDRVTRGKKNSTAKKRIMHELDNGMVPLPAKHCFECRKSCRRAPLLSCDYCPLLFHLDCLDPPLTALPYGRWMCPNHVEQGIDERLLTSLSVTQRVALWDRYSGPIDQDSIKTDFLQKTRRKNPPFRFKVKLAPRNRVQVPNAVREQYKHKPQLLPSLKDVLRKNDLRNREAMHPYHMTEGNEELSGEQATEDEQEEWLSGIVALQTSIACHIASKKRKKSECSDTEEEHVHVPVIKDEAMSEDEEVMDIKKLTHRPKTDSVCPPSRSSLMNGMSGKDELEKEIPEGTTNGPIQLSEPENFSSQTFSNGVVNADEDDDQVMIKAYKPENVSHLNKKISSEAHLSRNDGRKVTDRDNVCTHKGFDGLHSVLQASLESSIQNGPSERSLDNLDDKLIRLLALQRLRQIASSSKPSPPPVSSTGKQTEAEVTQPGASVTWPCPESGLRPRALLTPINCSQPPMPMYYRVVEIGTGGDMDVCLNYYGHCNFVSAKHAVIVCDEVNRHYELINYSEHGTTVDNVLYSCDFSEKPPVKEQQQPQPPQPQHGRRSGGGSNSMSTEQVETEVEVPPLIQKIRAIVDKRRGVTREEDMILEPPNLPADIGKVDLRCNCRSSSSSLIGGSGAGWEGTALLNHGSFIKLGCIQFTFSILNQYAPLVKQTSFEPLDLPTIEDTRLTGTPHPIIKRERDSTSSSTLTVSLSPPPEKPLGKSKSRSIRRNGKISSASKFPVEENDNEDITNDCAEDDNDDDDNDNEEDEDEDTEEEEEDDDCDETEDQDEVDEEEFQNDNTPMVSKSMPGTSGLSPAAVTSISRSDV